MPLHPSRSVVVIAALAALSVFPRPCPADVDAQIGSGDKVLGSLVPATEVESYTVMCPPGSKLKVKATGLKGGPVVTFRVLHPNLGEVAQDLIVPKGSGAQLGKYVTPDAEPLVIEVRSADGIATGDYKLSAKWTPPRKLVIDEVLGGDETAYDFFANAGARVKAKLIAAGGSTAVPRLLRLEGPGGFVRNFAAGKRAKVGSEKITLPSTGGYTFFFDDSSGLGGGVGGSVTVQPPPPSKVPLDLTSLVIDPDASGSERAVARVIGTGGGGFTVPPVDDPGPFDIAGAAVEFPPGALPGALAIVIATAPTLEPPEEGMSGVGPTVFFAPEGVDFGADATVTLPFDAALFDGDFASLRVFTRDADGNVTEVDPDTYVFDEEEGTISFPTSHFSSFRVFGAPPGPLDGQDVLLLGDLDDPEDLSGEPALGGGQQYQYGPLPPYLVVAEGDEEFASAIFTSSNPYYSGAKPPRDTSVGGYITPLVGLGGYPVGYSSYGDVDLEGPVRSVELVSGYGLYAYVATETRIVTVVQSEGIRVRAFAGSTTPGDSGDGGPADKATFTSIRNIRNLGGGDMLVVDRGAHRIRILTGNDGPPDIEAFAGTGEAAFGADGVDRLSTTFLDPTDVLVLGDDVFVTDAGRVRRFSLTDTSMNETFAGDPGGAMGAHDGHLTAEARFRTLTSITYDLDGILYVADPDNHVIWALDGDRGRAFPAVGTPGVAGTPPEDPFLAPGVANRPLAVMWSGGYLYYTEETGARLLRVGSGSRGGEILVPGKLTR